MRSVPLGKPAYDGVISGRDYAASSPGKRVFVDTDNDLWFEVSTGLFVYTALQTEEEAQRIYRRNPEVAHTLGELLLSYPEGTLTTE